MKIGIYGGTFNPPHRGHVLAAASAVRELGLDRLIVMPSGTPPHKEVPAGNPDGEERLALARLAFASVDRAEVSDYEVASEGKDYTIDTLNWFEERCPGDELILITGGDMFRTLPEWKRGEEILRRFSVAVLAREFEEEPELTAAAEAYRADYGATVYFPKAEVFPVSSTEIRAKLPLRQGADLLPAPVYAEIIRRRLYGAKPDFAWLREQAYAMLKPSRVAHVKGCEEEAVRMARFWGADPEEAAEAAILHDVTKKLDLEHQLILCRKYDIVIDALESRSEKLLHSKTGAAVAKYEFGVSDEVYTAIQWHTTGRPGMSLLEKILYLSDYMEPSRRFEGVEELRRLSYEDLDRAMALGLSMSVDDLTARGVEIHRMTEQAMSFYCRGEENKEC